MMRQHAGVLGVVIAFAAVSPDRVEAQQAWKPLPVADARTGSTPWAVAVDSQKVVRLGEGVYSLYLKWTPLADSLPAPRANAIERHRLDCSARQTTYSNAFMVPIAGAKDLIFAFSDAPETSLTFDGAGAQRDQLESVCRWAQGAVR